MINDRAKAIRSALLTAYNVGKAGGGDVEPDDFNPRAVIGGNNPPTPVYYSALKQGVVDAKQMQATPQDWKAITAPGKLPGVKQEEIDYSGLHNFLDTQQGQVSKDDLLNHLEQNPAVNLNEVWKSKPKKGTPESVLQTAGFPEETSTKYHSLQLPEGSNYKELLLTLPTKTQEYENKFKKIAAKYGRSENSSGYDSYASPEEIKELEKLADQAENIKPYTHRHWEEPNVLAHIRMNDRVGPNGEKLLHIEELQSDWHQEGREDGYASDGYKYWLVNKKSGNKSVLFNSEKEAQELREGFPENLRGQLSIQHSQVKTDGVPDAPYKDTKDWTALALKRVMRHAANNNYDGITWTTGDQQADRYDLSKQVSSIEADQYNIADENGWRLNVKGKNGDSIPMPGHYLSDDELADHVGKDMAKKIIDSNGGEFHGLDLKVGGEGMRKYYDEIVPSVANKLAKEHGVKHSMIQYPESGKKYRIEQVGTQMGRPSYTAYDEDDNIIDRSTIRQDVEDVVKQKKGMAGEKLHYLPVTSSMKKSAKLFKGGGMVEPYKHTGVIGDAEKAKRRALMIARGLHKAAGGDVEEDEAPASSGKTVNNALPGQPTRTFVEPKQGNKHVFAVTDPDKDVTTKSLAAETNAALAHHMSLPQGQQISNSKAAGNKLAPYVGRDNTGGVKPFLTMNAKLEKASAGYEAGKGYEGVDPLKLEGGIGVKTIGLPLSPAYQHNKYKVCPNAASCKESCLGTTSGNYSNADWWPQQNSLNKTHAFLSEPGALAVQLHNEIKREKYAAEMQGNKLAVRMNVLSDTNPRVWEPLIKAHPDVDFYDYTKMNYDPIAPNLHYTYSSTGVSQPKENTGLDKDIYNPNQNWKQMRQRLDTGSNVAMVFTHNDHLPNEVHDQENGKKYRVIDGTTHDYRPLDKQPEGSDGVIVGLRNLDHRKGRDVAAEKSKGFMVHYNPKIQMVPNKRTGEPTLKAMKDNNGATIPTNRTVEISPQSKNSVPHNQREGRAHGGSVGDEMPQEYAIQQFHNFNKFDEPNEGPSAHQRQYAYGGPVEGDVVRRALNLTRQARS